MSRAFFVTPPPANEEERQFKVSTSIPPQGIEHKKELAKDPGISFFFCLFKTEVKRLLINQSLRKFFAEVMLNLESLRNS